MEPDLSGVPRKMDFGQYSRCGSTAAATKRAAAQKETAEGGGVPSMRDRMAQHRVNPACSGCHNLMDPIGLSTENFDAVGRWRDHYEGGTPIDASGALPDGTTYVGAVGLRRRC